MISKMIAGRGLAELDSSSKQRCMCMLQLCIVWYSFVPSQKFVQPVPCFA